MHIKVLRINVREDAGNIVPEDGVLDGEHICRTRKRLPAARSIRDKFCYCRFPNKRIEILLRESKVFIVLPPFHKLRFKDKKRDQRSRNGGGLGFSGMGGSGRMSE